jgi:hypothetical protein
VYPRVDVDPPDISNVDEEGIYERVTEFALAHPRPIVVVGLVIALMLLWNKPWFRYGIIGALVLTLILVVVMR